jgi:DNA-directed DNA polymerase III PolC
MTSNKHSKMKKDILVNIRNRTEHSYRTAYGKVDNVVAIQKAPYAAITDRHGTWGHVRWSRVCKAAGIKPIFGVELAVVQDMEVREKQNTCHMNFLAINDAGLREIYELVTLATEKFYYVPRVDFNAVSDVMASGNIICTSGSCTDLSQLGKGLKNFYVELNQLSPKFVPAMASDFGYELVATGDNLYPRPEDKAAYEIVLGKDRISRTAAGHILDRWQWLEFWPEHEEAIFNSFRIAEQCDANLPSAEMIHPEITKTLDQLCIEGAKRLEIDLKNETYKARLKRELDLIKEKKFEDYFHVVADMVNYAREHMLVGPARGSSCGSLVCYLIGITGIDPIPYDLLFERFIDINREDYPDIDIDFQEDKREMVFDYLRTKYGHDRVSRLGTISVFKAKSAITDVAKQLRIPVWEVQDLKDSIIERSTGDSRAAFCILDTFEQLDIGRKTLEKYPELRYSADLEGHARHTGVHAAGIIVTAHPVTNYCSINQQTGAAMLDKYDAEKLNLLKIDALGLRTLSVLQDTLDQIGWDRAKLEKYPLDDKKAFDVLNVGKFSGIFQFEGYALQSLTKQMHVDGIEDIVSITALARPGPLNSGGATEFLKRRMGLSEVKYLHPMAEAITKVTYGVIVYQEQVMQIAREIGGLSWEDVSQLRKAMSKSLGKEFFDKYWERFKVGAKKNSIKEAQAKVIWDNINTMGSWAFNRSHAVAYGLMSYWCLVMKAHYPLEFAASCLRNAKDDDQSVKILRELVNEGYSYKPYDAKHSKINWSVQQGQLIGGLISIKGIGAKLAESIVRKRDNELPLTAREQRLMAEGVTPWDSVFEAKDKWGHIRQAPGKYGIESNIVDLEEITQESNGMFVFIGKLTEKNLRDHNELQNLEKRGGRRMEGQTLFLNITVEDDTSSMICTINKYRYLQYGLPIVEEGKIGDWYIFKGENKRGFRKIHIHRWKKLTGNTDFTL